ncbi:haloacid dehalogenase [Sulfurimonas sp. SAG-AH-194-C21]|nr:haloacid dehalogenase [Sulfurimonas sp. SAG-AH-194-C21]MDF1884345.1 haloacid dehalogenase [Sulfurimonas sp. SAG-AH-194-C21]
MYENIKHIILDYNGTIAKDGVLKKEIDPLLKELSKNYTLHVITADTFGSVKEQIKDYDIKLHILKSDDHTKEKKDYVTSLGCDISLAIGNGNNDKKMLETAQIGIAVLGDEGCCTQALLVSDIVCKSITDALELPLNPKRLLATLRI